MSHDPSALDGMLSAAVTRHLHGAPADDPCPDAETLAVYLERRAGADERARLERHLAACARCQAHLAALVRSDPATVAPRGGWPWFALPWRLAVPIASAAIVVLSVWIARAPSSRSPELDQLDQITEQAAPPAELDSRLRPNVPPATPAPRAQSSEAARADAQKAEDRAGFDARREASESPRPAKEPETIGSTAAKLEDKNRPAAAAPVRAPQTAAEPLVSGRVATSPQERAQELELSRDRAVSSFWRLAGGAVERTLDGGATWTDRFAPSSPTLRAVAGSSPSVAWAVGDEGAVFRTIDGTTWRSVPFPERAPLVAVEVSDAQRVVVTAADGRRFVTADGGLSWAF